MRLEKSKQRVRNVRREEDCRQNFGGFYGKIYNRNGNREVEEMEDKLIKWNEGKGNLKKKFIFSRENQ